MDFAAFYCNFAPLPKPPNLFTVYYRNIQNMHSGEAEGSCRSEPIHSVWCHDYVRSIEPKQVLVHMNKNNNGGRHSASASKSGPFDFKRKISAALK